MPMFKSVENILTSVRDGIARLVSSSNKTEFVGYFAMAIPNGNGALKLTVPAGATQAIMYVEIASGFLPAVMSAGTGTSPWVPAARWTLHGVDPSGSANGSIGEVGCPMFFGKELVITGAANLAAFRIIGVSGQASTALKVVFFK